jgi:hypothetical protein
MRDSEFMARMLPAAIAEATLSAAERRLFHLLKNDPATADWIVLHSLGLSRRGKKPYGEVDFVVIIPRGGVFCLEVKGGRVACRDGEWETTDRNGQTARLRRSPFLQARDSMFAVRDAVLSRAPVGFPAGVLHGYAVVMPDVSFMERSPEWEPWQVIDRDALTPSIAAPLLRLAAGHRTMHPHVPPSEPTPHTMSIIRQTLRPDFEVVVSRGARIDDTEAQLLRLTEEQFHALDLMADNERCLFEGAAGTGKTMLAFEYARRMSEAGHRTLLICFNRLLGDWFTRQAAALPQPRYLTSGSYFRLLRDIIVTSSISTEFLEQESHGANTTLYEDTYAVCGRLAVEELNLPYDVLVMDEGQDLLQPHVLDVLNVWLRGGFAMGRWAIFGDFQRQAIFGNRKGDQLKAALSQVAPQSAKGRLTLNCRNTRNIGQETALLSGFAAPPYRMGQVLGLPVDYQYYGSEHQQAALLAAEVRRLLADGVRADDIIVLSPLRLSNSGVAAVDSGGMFRLVDVQDHTPTRSSVPVIRYTTAHAFKGLESPVVILCDIDQVGDGEPQSLLYVAMSRARSHLIMFVHEGTRRSIAACVRRKLEDAWSVHT